MTRWLTRAVSVVAAALLVVLLGASYSYAVHSPAPAPTLAPGQTVQPGSWACDETPVYTLGPLGSREWTRSDTRCDVTRWVTGPAPSPTATGTVDVRLVGPTPLPVAVREAPPTRTELRCAPASSDPSASPSASPSEPLASPSASPASPSPASSSGCAFAATLDAQQYLVMGVGVALLLFVAVVGLVRREAVPVLR